MYLNLQYSPVYYSKLQEKGETDEIHYQIVNIFIYFEIFSIILEIPCYGLAVYGCCKSPFHFNLTSISVYILASYFQYIIGRLITCFYEIGVLQFDVPDEISDYPKFLIIASFLQFYFMGCVCLVLPSIVAERSIATIYVTSYERRKKKYVSFFTCSLSTLFCFVAALGLLYDVVPLSYLALFGFGINIAAFIIFNILYKINKQFTKNLKHASDKYTLSLRFQLKENMKVMTLFRNIILITSLINFLMGAIFYIYNDRHYRTQPILSLYLRCGFNLMGITYSFSVIFIALLSVRQYRIYFFSLRYIHVFTYPILGRCFEKEYSTSKILSMSASAETDAYFNNLGEQWGMRFNEKELAK